MPFPSPSGGAWGGAAAGVQDATNTAMTAIGGIAQMKQNQAIQDTNTARLKIEQGQAAIQQYQAQKQKEKQERDDKLLYPDEVMPGAKDNPESYKVFQGIAAPFMQKDPMGKSVIRAEDFKTVIQTLHSDKTMGMEMAMAHFKDVSANIDKISGQIQDLQGKGELNEKDQEELAGLQKQQKTQEAVRNMLNYTINPKADQKGRYHTNAQGITTDTVTGETSGTPKEGGGNTDFSTFKAGRPKQEGESNAAWNKRVSDEWESKQDERSKNKASFSVNIHEAALEKAAAKPLPPKISKGVDNLVSDITNLRLGPTSAMSSFVQRMGGANAGAIRLEVENRIKEKYPNFDITKADAYAQQEKRPDLIRAQENIGSVEETIQQVKKLIPALQNHDMRVYNEVNQWWKKQLGSSAPTNWQTAAVVTATEMAKASNSMSVVVPTGRFDKEIENLSKVNSPEQLTGSMDTNLMLLGPIKHSIDRMRHPYTKEEILGTQGATDQGAVDLNKFWK